MTWFENYSESYADTLTALKKIDGVAVGFNTNVDAIIEFRSNKIRELISHLQFDTVTLMSKILKWKGVIEEPEDFIVGLCGCFEKGKASEWIIQNEETYQFLLRNLPTDRVISMGGQAGNMANTLSELGIPRVIVHSATLPDELKNLFLKNKNIQIPVYNKKGKLEFPHPRKAKNFDDRLFLHLISEVSKNDQLNIDNNIRWKCPRDNRFIATYDPPNAQMKIIEGFSRGIEEIAEKVNVLVLSGFHMLSDEGEGIKKIEEKIMSVIELIQRAKIANLDLLVHLELCSTKQKEIMNLLMKLSKQNQCWDSIGGNEREIIEVLEAINENKLARAIKNGFSQGDILAGCVKILDKLSLKQVLLHQYGCYLLAASWDYQVPNEILRKSLCFASLITSHKALAVKSIGEIEFSSIINLSNIYYDSTKTFSELRKFIEENYQNSEQFSVTGILETEEARIIAIPTLIVDDPIYTVGLGDGISSATLAAEVALQKIQS